MDDRILEDEDLMAAVAKGRREALEPLLRRHATPLLTFVERMAGNRHRGEELFQEVFLLVWKNRRTYEYPRPFRAWLYAIAVNRCRTELRRASLPVKPLQEEDCPPDPTSCSPVEMAIATERATLVAESVALLPPRQREVMILRIWQQLDYGEIATILDSTESTVRANMHHGLSKLREMLAPRLHNS